MEHKETKSQRAMHRVVVLCVLVSLCFISLGAFSQANDASPATATSSRLRVISGTVVSDATGKPVVGATVAVQPAGNPVVVTNDDGFFTIKTDGKVKALSVSHVGYKMQTVAVRPTDGSDSPTVKGDSPTVIEELRSPIRLQPAVIQLHEVLVTADNARELVNKAIARIPRNYMKTPELYRCFYRETATKRQHHICVAEGVVDMYKTGYHHGTGRDRVAIYKGRRLLSPKQSDTLSVKVLGGPVAPVQLDIVKNTDFFLNKEDLDCYEFRMEMPTTIADRPQYVVAFRPLPFTFRQLPYALYIGKLYIDQQTLAFTRAELSLDMSDRMKATERILVKKPAGVRFRPKEMSFLIDYRMGLDNIMRISYVRVVFRFNCDWKRRLFATSFTACCEMVVTSFNTPPATYQPIKGRESFDQRDAFYDKVDFFRDPDFWQDYNIIEPTESLDRAINRLLKKTAQ